jgi:hypothetical protein
MVEGQKSGAEIQAAEVEFFNRRWYQASLDLEEQGEGWPEDEAARGKIALDHPLCLSDLEQRESDYHRGWLDGVHQALRWVLGDGDRVEDASLET